jgi:HEAT repeat protein
MLPHLLSELTSGDDERAQQAVRELAALGSKAIPHLVELASAAETDHRWWAIYALVEIDHPDVFPHLRHALADPDVSVRECAAMGLRLHPNPVAIPELIEAMKMPHLMLAWPLTPSSLWGRRPCLPCLRSWMARHKTLA